MRIEGTPHRLRSSILTAQLLERDHCPKTTRAALFGAVREPVLRIAGGTNAGNLYVFHTRAFEQHFVRFPEIEVNLTAVRSEHLFRFVTELFHYLDDDICANLIMIGAYRWTNACMDICRIGTIAFPHGMDRGGCNVA